MQVIIHKSSRRDNSIGYNLTRLNSSLGYHDATQKQNQNGAGYASLMFRRFHESS